MNVARVPLSGESRYVGCHMEGFAGFSLRSLIHQLLQTHFRFKHVKRFELGATKHDGWKVTGNMHDKDISSMHSLGCYRSDLSRLNRIPTDLEAGL